MSEVNLKEGLLGEKINVVLIQIESPFYDELWDAAVDKNRKLFFWRNIENRRDKIIALLENIKDTITDPTIFPDVIVFPEYTVPHEILDEIKEFLKYYKIIIAGSDQVRDQNSEMYRKNVCPIMIRNMDTFYVEKNTPNKEELGKIEPGKKENRSLELHWESNKNELCLAVTICIDYLDPDQRLDKERNGCIIVPMCSQSMQDFVGLQRRDVRFNKFVIFCNTVTLSDKKLSMAGQSAIYGEDENREKNGAIISLNGSMEGVILARLNLANPNIHKFTTIPPSRPVEHKAAYSITHDYRIKIITESNEKYKKIGIINPYLYSDNIKMLSLIFLESASYSSYKQVVKLLSEPNFNSFGILGDHDIVSMRFLEAGEETRLKENLKKKFTGGDASYGRSPIAFINVKEIYKFYGYKPLPISKEISKSLPENPQLNKKLISLSKNWDTTDVSVFEKKELMDNKLILGEYDGIDLREKNFLRVFMCIYLSSRSAALAGIFEQRVLEEFLFTESNVLSIYQTTAPSSFKCEYLVDVLDTPHNIFDLILKIHSQALDNQIGVSTNTFVVVEELCSGIFNEPPIKSASKENIFEFSTENLIKMDENQKLEFKSSLRWDTKKGSVNKDLELPIVKTISAFMNASGGILLIGIDPYKNILGLENDFLTLKDKNEDGFERQLKSLIVTYIGKQFQNNVHITFSKLDNKVICKVVVPKRASKPAFLGEKKEFYTRTGNSTSMFNTQEANEYIKMYWKNY